MGNEIEAVKYTLPEVADRLQDWQKIEHCIAGERAVKEQLTKYLPMPNADDTSAENVARYAAYVQRAVFYNVTKRTHAGLTALAFVDKPVIELPTGLQVLLADVDGSGLSLEQQLHETLDGVAAHGRYGLFVDYPTVVGPVSQSRLARSTELRPIVRTYKPWQIINWDTIVCGARTVLSLVVLAETYSRRAKDGFSVEKGNQWRVLRLTPAGYDVLVYKQAIGGEQDTIEQFTPLDRSGSRLQEIPFIACGATNNEIGIDDPPMLDIACMNVAHYRNSADYEESVFLCGQATPTLEGMTKDWWENVLHKIVRLGSRSAVALPQGSTLRLVQAEPNGIVREAMQDKERAMVALGARLIQQTSVQRTATEAKIETASEMSVLSLCSQNVAAGYTKCLAWAGVFAGEKAASTIELHPNAELERMTPEERAALIADLQAGALSFTEVRNKLRSAGLATEDDKLVAAAREAKVDKPRPDPVTETNDPKL